MPRFAPAGRGGRRSCMPQRRPGGGRWNLLRANAIPGRPGRPRISTWPAAILLGEYWTQLPLRLCAIEHYWTDAFGCTLQSSDQSWSCSGMPLPDGTDAVLCRLSTAVGRKWNVCARIKYARLTLRRMSGEASAQQLWAIWIMGIADLSFFVD